MSENGFYDSTDDTRRHCREVWRCIQQIRDELGPRAWDHDLSKLNPPEKEGFDRATMRLRTLTYSSDEYKAALADLKPTLDHHYAENRHHPEHFKNGVDGMTLIDIIEMFCDWKAATLRHENGDFGESIELNQTRFNLSDQLTSIFRNTKDALGW